MHIVYLGYWGAYEGLSRSTIWPHLTILAQNKLVSSITYISIERDGHVLTKADWSSSKITHVPYHSKKRGLYVITKFWDLLALTFCVRREFKKTGQNTLICRTSLAGIVGWAVNKLTNVPYMVESFEPHASYMLDAEVWSESCIAYKFQKWGEKKQLQTARLLCPVSMNYTHRLVEEGIDSNRLRVMPCNVDLDVFAFNEEERNKIRASEKIHSDALVGIYVGKFGSIYYDVEAFDLFERCFRLWPNFHLIILSPDDPRSISEKLNAANCTSSSVTIKCVEHHLVPAYLSASDVAFSLPRTRKNSIYCSPIKDGEYWANGLPMIIPPRVGDDSSIIQESRLGWVIDVDHLSDDQIHSILPELKSKTREAWNSEVMELARKHRNFSTVEQIYSEFISKMRE